MSKLFNFRNSTKKNTIFDESTCNELYRIAEPWIQPAAHKAIEMRRLLDEAQLQQTGKTVHAFGFPAPRSLAWSANEIDRTSPEGAAEAERSLSGLATDAILMAGEIEIQEIPDLAKKKLPAIQA